MDKRQKSPIHFRSWTPFPVWGHGGLSNRINFNDTQHQFRASDRTVTEQIPPNLDVEYTHTTVSCIDTISQYNDNVSELAAMHHLSVLDSINVSEDCTHMPNTIIDYNSPWATWDGESRFWVYDDPAHVIPQSIRLNPQYILERMLSLRTSLEYFAGIYNIDVEKFETIIQSPQWRLEVERFCESRNITLDHSHLVLFGCDPTRPVESIGANVEMPTRMSESEMTLIPDREDDFNIDINWREYPLPQHGASWRYSDILAGNAITTVRIHARFILSCLANQYIRELENIVSILTNSQDFRLWYNLSEEDWFGIRKSLQWKYEVDDFLLDNSDIEDTPDHRRFLGQLDSHHVDVLMNAVPDPSNISMLEPGSDYNEHLVWTMLEDSDGDTGNIHWEISGEDAVWRYDTNGRVSETRVSVWDIMEHRRSDIPRPRWLQIPDMYVELTYYRLQEMRSSPQWTYEMNRFMGMHNIENTPENVRIFGLITRAESREHLTVGGIDINQTSDIQQIESIGSVSIPTQQSYGQTYGEGLSSEGTSPPNISVPPDTVETVSLVPDIGNQAKRKFGVEIELLAPLAMVEVCQAINESGVTCRQESYNHQRRDWWKVVPDASVGGLNMNPMEVVSRPLKNNDGLIEIENVIRVLNNIGCEVNKNCGLHVHVEASRLRVEQLRNIAFAWVAYEHVVESLIPPSRRHESERRYCRSIIGYSTVSDYRRDRLFDRLHISYDKNRITRVMNPDDDRMFKLNFQSLSSPRHAGIQIPQRYLQRQEDIKPYPILYSIRKSL